MESRTKVAILYPVWLIDYEGLVPIEYGLEHQLPSLFRADINDASDLIEVKVVIGMSQPSLRNGFARS